MPFLQPATMEQRTTGKDKLMGGTSENVIRSAPIDRVTKVARWDGPDLTLLVRITGLVYRARQL